MMAKQPSPKVCGNCKLSVTENDVRNLLVHSQYPMIEDYEKHTFNCPKCHLNNKKGVMKTEHNADDKNITKFNESRIALNESIIDIMFGNKNSTVTT